MLANVCKVWKRIHQKFKVDQIFQNGTSNLNSSHKKSNDGQSVVHLAREIFFFYDSFS
jgi:hypothetical protein